MNLGTYYRTLGAILCAFTLLGWFAVTSFESFRRYTLESEQVEKIQIVFNHISLLTLASYKMDLEQQYFLATGKMKYMERFVEAKSHLRKSLREFSQLYKPRELSNELAEIERLLESRIEFGDHMVKTRERDGYLPAFQIFLNEKNRRQMTQLDSKLGEILKRTETALATLSNISRGNMGHALGDFVTAGCIAFAIILIFSVLIIRDLKYRDRKERELSVTRESALRASNFKSQFLANMSHEIRTPLNCIIGMADVLVDTHLTIEQTGHVKNLQKAGDSLLNIINNVLDLSKVEAGEMKLESIGFNAYQLCHEVVEFMSVKANEKNLRLALNYEASERHFIGDPTRVRQILINLIGNALKFTDIGGVTLRVSRKDQMSLFEVQDSGKGITPEKMKAIFEPFSQEDLSTARQYGGTGLGLSITKQLSELMKGRILVTSQVGVGSVFSVSLPLTVSTHFVTSPVASPPHELVSTNVVPLRPQSGPISDKILIVDDTEDNRLLIKLYLKNCPVELGFAENGKEAVDKVILGSYSLILMDMQMPVMDGYTAAETIRMQERALNRKPSKIVALSACAFKEEIEKSLKAGCDEHMSKPIRKIDLISLISRMLNRDLHQPVSQDVGT